jgi:MFS transporter, OFA family, oxalate/formate antiporter
MLQNSCDKQNGPLALTACCIAIFWPGAFIFGLPGVLSSYWQQNLGVGQMEIGRVLFFALAAAGIFMFVTGRCQMRFGVQKVAIAGALIVAASQCLLLFAKNIQLVYVWAFITSAAVCFVNLPVITVAQLWYPKRRGLASGLVNLSFGLSAGILAPLFNYILYHFGHTQLVLFMSTFSLLFGMISSMFVQPPEELISEVQHAPNQTMTESSLTPLQSLKTRTFWLIWGVYALAGAAGVSMITNAVTFGLSKSLSIAQAVLILSAFNIASGLSRIISGYLSDYLGRKQTLAAIFFLSGIAYFSMDHLQGISMWLTCAAVIGFSFGTLFAVTQPLLADSFGMDHFGIIYGMIFTAYGFFAGIFGPWVSGYWLDVTLNNFTVVFIYLGSLSLLAAIMIGLVKQKIISHSN